MNEEDKRIIKEDETKYIVYFAELGDYDSLNYRFDTFEEACKRLKELEAEYPLHYGYVAKILVVVRNSEVEGEENDG